MDGPVGEKIPFFLFRRSLNGIFLGLIELDSAEVYLLDGTKLGSVKNLMKPSHALQKLKKGSRPQKSPDKVHV